jgi:SnoaL-like protein
MSAPTPSEARVEIAADFVRRFAEYWQAPSADRLDAVLGEGVRLVTPLTPTTDTLDDAKRIFAGLLAQIPDLTAEVHRWGATDDGVLIEFTLSGTGADGVLIEWQAVDRFVIGADGLATERVSYFDPTSIQSSNPT